MVNRYQQYKDSGVEWLGDVPAHWKVTRLINRVENRTGGDWGEDPESDVIDHVVLPVIRVQDIEKEYEINIDNLTQRKIKSSKIINRLINVNSLLIEKSGGGEKQNVGRVAIPSQIEFPAICSNFMEKLDFDRKVSTRFFNYLFHSLYNQNLNNPYVQQTTGIQNINSTYYLYTRVAYPSTSEQTSIANYLDQATAKIDSVISLKQQQLVKLEQYRKSKIHECVTKGLNPKAPMKDSGIEWIGLVPEHWKVEKLKYLTSLIIDGTHFTPNYLDNEDGIPFFRVTDIQTDEIEYSRLKKISQEEYIELNRRCNPEKGDLLLSKNGTIGITKVVTWDYPFSLFVSLCLIKPLEKLNVNYLDYLFKCGFFEQQISDSSKATTVTNLHLEMIKDFSLLKPPIIEQSEIVAHLDSFLESFKLEKSIIEQQILKLQQYRKSLIHECVTGKRKVA